MKTDRKEIIKRQIAGLESLSQNELKNKFTELFGFECGETNVRNLRKRLAYRLQEICLGGLEDEDAAILDSIAAEDNLAKLEQPPARVLAKTPGTRFCRVWKSVEHEAVVLAAVCLSTTTKSTVPSRRWQTPSPEGTGTANYSLE